METYKKSLKQNCYLRDMANLERKEGRLEGKKQIAIRLLQRKTSIEDIISLTDLTREEVQELLK